MHVIYFYDIAESFILVVEYTKSLQIKSSYCFTLTAAKLELQVRSNTVQLYINFINYKFGI